MTKDEALKQALGTLEGLFGTSAWYTGASSNGAVAVWRLGGSDAPRRTITAIKEALTQPEQNLTCKSTQKRLAASWGYVEAQPEQEPVSTWGVATAHQAEVQRINSELQRLKIVFKTTGETE